MFHKAQLLSLVGHAVAHQPLQQNFHIVSRIDQLFPLAPVGNSMLATVYIAILPTLVLFLLPPQIPAFSLNLMVSFAMGTMLGDVFLHMLPHTFESATHETEMTIALAVLGGFLGLFVLDKLMRIVQSEQGHTSGHSHSHAVEKKEDVPSSASSASSSLYMTLLGSLSHNLADTLTLASSFHHSKHLGQHTAMVSVFHDLPHHIGDFALLMNSGMSKWQLLQTQVLSVAMSLGVTVLSGHLPLQGPYTLPITTGALMYSCLGNIPELLEIDSQVTSKWAHFGRFLVQLAALAFGVGLMAFIGMHE